MLDQTNDPTLRSWVDAANVADCDFPIQNLPYGSFNVRGTQRRLGVAIGDQVLDLPAAVDAGLLQIGDAAGALRASTLNAFMAEGPASWSVLRLALSHLLSSGNALLRDDDALRARVLHPMESVTLHLPFDIAEYTDFYASRHHAFNVGSMFRGPENALPPNWLHIPIGYNGRASSVVVSGTPVRRPWGQVKGSEDSAPRFAPSARFDIELEIGAIVGVPSDRPLTVGEAFENIFGYVLLNDWSARDIQAWEYQPLGPFQSKATATSLSPWVVTAAALEPFRVDTPAREVPLPPHLRDAGPMLYDIALDVALAPEGGRETVISRTNYREMYYSTAQQLAHHSTCGCPMRVGDLLGSGTISGPEPGSRGSLLELSWGGRDPVEIDGGTRTFIEDGDTLTLRGHAQGDGFRIGFGECCGTLLPVKTPQRDS
ncbi:fumarylacetoacetase [Tropicimonas marinistellae]|uniref:fumarylacetoacetase n=1 Tax=Tropicimonas marinistellae TaxID=1739787 RepID=UPI000AC4D3F6|nr:fumarylacetoacetase [Tropicimonas marinistellae]